MAERLANSLQNRAINFAVNYVFPRGVIALDRTLEWVIERNVHNPSIFKETKRLGILTVDTLPADFEFNDAGRGMHIQENDPIIEIHLPPVKRKDRSFENVSESFRLLAEYIRIHHLQAQYLVGFTYERMAAISKRYGFEQVDYRFSPLKKRHMVEKFSLYQKAGFLKSPAGEPRMVIQSREDFLARFGRVE